MLPSWSRVPEADDARPASIGEEVEPRTITDARDTKPSVAATWCRYSTHSSFCMRYRLRPPSIIARSLRECICLLRSAQMLSERDVEWNELNERNAT